MERNVYPTEQEILDRHQQLNRSAPADRIVIREGMEFIIDEDSRISIEHFCWRYYAGNVELDHFLAKTMRRRRLLDVGSLHGVFSLVFAARPGAQALAIEPSPVALKRLRTNCRLNPELDIRVVDCAAGAAEGVIPMRFEWEHLVAGGADAAKDMMIRVRSVDDILLDLRYAPDVVKIYVEGYEKRVLDGMAKTLEHLRPDLHLECHGPLLLAAGDHPKDIFDILDRYGYRPMNIWTGEEVTYRDETYPNVWHLYCAPRERNWLRP